MKSAHSRSIQDQTNRMNHKCTVDFVTGIGTAADFITTDYNIPGDFFLF